MILIGIDLGGRTTGKTAVSVYNSENNIVKVIGVKEIEKITSGIDENFIEFLNELNGNIIGIDAPLSLPDFTQKDYLYRSGDREVKALSPMTIGEITARAIFLNSKLNCEVIEVYPKSVLQFLGLQSTKYKNNEKLLRNITNIVISKYKMIPNQFEMINDNVDSLLSLVAVIHYFRNSYRNIGNKTKFIIPK